MTHITVDQSTTSPASGRLSRGLLYRRLRRAVAVCYDLPAEPFCYAECPFLRTSIAFNVPPDRL